MTELTDEQLIQKAMSVVNPKKISDGISAGDVGCALLSEGNNVYLGVCIDAFCGIGFCAEHSAIAAMVTNGEYRIKKIVAVTKEGIIPPCGRCREFICQIDEGNWDTDVIVGEGKVVKLKELLPDHWRK